MTAKMSDAQKRPKYASEMNPPKIDVMKEVPQ